MKLLHVKNLPILEQLRLEEALIRTSSENVCIINEGSPRAIIMGISGKVNEWVDNKKTTRDNIPVIKRFSGGGTVVVDENTLFVSFLFNKKDHPSPAYPESLLRWSETFYKKVFDHPEFALKENDYVIGHHKCGGNAQYIRKDNFIHHTTFLWDYDPSNMEYLLHPKKTPKYRQEREHSDFLCRLKDHLPCKQTFIKKIKLSLKEFGPIENASLDQFNAYKAKSHRKATSLI